MKVWLGTAAAFGIVLGLAHLPAEAARLLGLAGWFTVLYLLTLGRR